MTTERQDYFAPGDWNAICDGCGAKLKGNALRKDWQGFMKCTRCWEPRHPQDFVRGQADPQSVPWTRGDSIDYSLPLCTHEGSLAIPSFAIAGCMIASRNY